MNYPLHLTLVVNVSQYNGKKNVKALCNMLHSSRMRTAHALTVSPSMLCAGGGAWSGGCLLWGGGLLPEGVPGPGGMLGGGWYPSMH